MKTLKLKNIQPERLDKIVAQHLDLSRSAIQKYIQQGHILVDGKVSNKKTLVTKECAITYAFPKKKRSLLSRKPKIALDILYEDNDVIVVCKPAGLLVHPTQTSTEQTLKDGLIRHDKKIKNIGDDPERPGIVHRLDKFTSGVLIAAKSQEAFDYLKHQFKQRKVKKIYSALVHGVMEKPHDTITLSIARSKQTGKMAAKPENQGGKSAITHYTVVEQFPHHALLEVSIETGRTNQIRAHMFAINHPIVGDPIYKQRSQKLMNIHRIFLHAKELTITLPSGTTKTFTAPLPAELEEVLKSIPKT